MEIILVRHTSVDVPIGTCYGHTDVPVKDTFEQEAAQTKRQLEAYPPFDHVYCSPLTRCVKLATYCGYLNVPATNGESFMQLYQRVAQFLDELKQKDFAKVAVFAHGGVLLCAQIYVGDIKMDAAFEALTPYGGVVKINL